MKHILIYALLASPLIATPAAAQVADGLAAEMDIAQCIVDNDSRGVAKFLTTLPGSSDERYAAAPLVGLYGACDDNSETTGSFAWRERAQIATAAAAKQAERASTDLAAATQQPGWALEPPAGTDGGYDSNSVGLRMFGDCVVRAAPDAALDLLVSQSGSASESAAIAALTPALGPCLFAGQQISIARDNLRLVIGEPLYHLLAKYKADMKEAAQ